jgi:DNA-binding beta-propeller fold protein YncE
VALVACAAVFTDLATADGMQGIAIPTGQTITPTAASGASFQELDPRHPDYPGFRAGQASAVSISPDGRTLAILTSGFNRQYGPDGKGVPELSTEYVFLFDISGREPVQSQVLSLPNSFQGLAWAPSSERLYVSGGVDDCIIEYTRSGMTFVTSRTIHLNHAAGLGMATVKAGSDGKPTSFLDFAGAVRPETGGLAVSPDGAHLLVANFQNDSVSLIDTNSGQIIVEQDLRPGIIDSRRRGQPGGSYPRSVAWTSATRAYIASERDREIISVKVSKGKLSILHRVLVHGQPVALISSRNGSRLYAALDNTGEVAVVETAHDTVIESIDVTAPTALYANTERLGGANPNALALTSNEDILLVSNGGENAIAVIHLFPRGKSAQSSHRIEQAHRDNDDGHDVDAHSAVVALVPTGWYPTGVVTSKDEATWYVINGKSETGPDAGGCGTPLEVACRAANRIPWQLEKAGFLSLPAPTLPELARLTQQVARNNHLDRPADEARDRELFTFLRSHIEHVIYIIKENRSYDQILGDLETGNGDPRFTVFPKPLTPNHHAIARSFVTLDNFLASSEDSDTGWDWSTAARTNDFRERMSPLEAAGRETSWDQGVNRYINMGYATSKERKAALPISPSDPDILPGARDVSALDGPGGEEGKGFIWDAALRAGKTVRNWGFFDDQRYFLPGVVVPMERDPYAKNLKVYFPTKRSLMPNSDPYFRGFDPAFPDYWRVQEWRREFAGFVAAKAAPDLMLVRICTDHFGDFTRGIDGINSVETQMADNDYALGLIVETVAESPFAKNTVIVSVEDDTFDGPDHYDAHRSVALFAGAYVRQSALVSTRYTTVSVVKTIEELLGLEPVGLNDALAAPMSEVFDTKVSTWSYRAIVPGILRSTQLPLPPATTACNSRPKRSSEYWAKVMAGQDFSRADHLDLPAFNQALWRGLRGDEPYPTVTGADLRANRAQLLTKAHVGQNDTCGGT